MVKSAAIVVPDRDVSFALDTLRSFILKNDPTLMPMMLDLQLKIASVSFFFVVKYLLQFHLNLTFYFLKYLWYNYVKEGYYEAK